MKQRTCQGQTAYLRVTWHTLYILATKTTTNQSVELWPVFMRSYWTLYLQPAVKMFQNSDPFMWNFHWHSERFPNNTERYLLLEKYSAMSVYSFNVSAQISVLKFVVSNENIFIYTFYMFTECSRQLGKHSDQVFFSENGYFVFDMGHPCLFEQFQPS